MSNKTKWAKNNAITKLTTKKELTTKIFGTENLKTAKNYYFKA